MKIHDALVQAIRDNLPLNQQNTIHDNGRVYLYGNLLSIRSQNTLVLVDGGYPSRTTQSRLKAIIQAYNLPIVVRFLKGTIYFEYEHIRYPNKIEISI